MASYRKQSYMLITLMINVAVCVFSVIIILQLSAVLWLRQPGVEPINPWAPGILHLNCAKINMQLNRSSVGTLEELRHGRHRLLCLSRLVRPRLRCHWRLRCSIPACRVHRSQPGVNRCVCSFILSCPLIYLLCRSFVFIADNQGCISLASLFVSN